MNDSSWGLLSCQNSYNCIESFFLSVFSIFYLYAFVKSYRVIARDQNTILDKMDKIIFILAFTHLGLISLTYSIYSSPFFLFTIRGINLIEDTIMCTVVAYIYFLEERHPFIHKVMLIMIGWGILLWFFSIMDDSIDLLDLECNRMNSLLFSASCLIVSFILFLCGWGVLNIIRDSEKKQSIAEENMDLMDINHYVMENKKAQLRTFMIVSIISSLLQCIWDYKKYNSEFSDNICSNLTISHNLFTMFWLIILKIGCTLLPPWGIYYIFYWRNRNYFKSDTQYDLEMVMKNDFDIRRSEMIEPDST